MGRSRPNPRPGAGDAVNEVPRQRFNSWSNRAIAFRAGSGAGRSLPSAALKISVADSYSQPTAYLLRLPPLAAAWAYRPGIIRGASMSLLTGGRVTASRHPADTRRPIDRIIRTAHVLPVDADLGRVGNALTARIKATKKRLFRWWRDAAGRVGNPWRTGRTRSA